MENRTKKIFPIQSDTACLLKWSWSTIFLGIGTTSSCHRCNHDQLTVETFKDFHNTPNKIQARQLMREGVWPQKGCQYCEKIEAAGGVSDRQYQIDSDHDADRVPTELLQDPTANVVTPRTLEIYFSNTCNMGCLYCGPHFSSLWEMENNKHGTYRREMVWLPASSDGRLLSENTYQLMLNEFWVWLQKHHSDVHHLHILGGEPFYQKELDQVIDFFDDNPSPNMTLQLVTNLKVDNTRFKKTINKLLELKENNKVGQIQFTCSLDCWGPEQEYIRWGLSLDEWVNNFEYLLDKDIILGINAAITALSIKTMPEYFNKIKQWSKIAQRDIYISFMSVTDPRYMRPDIFGNLFKDDLNKILEAMPDDTPRQQHEKEHMAGIAKQILAEEKNERVIHNLKLYLTEIDKRRGTDWRKTFPWLVTQ